MIIKKLMANSCRFAIAALFLNAFHVGAQTLDRCIEFSDTGDLTCTVEPHLLEEWEYRLPGAPKATGGYPREEDAIAKRISDLKENMPSLCSEITYELSGYDETWQFANSTTGFMFYTQDARHRKPIVFRWMLRSNGICNLSRETHDFVYSSRDAFCDYAGGWSNSFHDPRSRFCYQQLKKETAPTDPIEDPSTCNTCPCLPKQDGSSAGNPILPATGEKLAIERDLQTLGAHPLTFERVYRSSRAGGGAGWLKSIGAPKASSSSGNKRRNSSVSATKYEEPVVPSMGIGWSTNLAARLTLDYSQVNVGNYKTNRAYLNFGDGRYRSFVLSVSDQWVARGTHKDKLIAHHPDGHLSANSLFIYQALDNDDQYVFGMRPGPTPVVGQSDLGHIGLLKEIRHRNGWVTRIEMDPQSVQGALRPLQATNHFGERLAFQYTPDGMISRVTHLNAAGAEVAHVAYQYEQQRLMRLTYPDGSTQELHYEDPNNVNLLTGLDRNGRRVSTFVYDAEGRAIETSKSGAVSRHTIQYSGSFNETSGVYNSVGLIDPMGTSRTYGYRTGGNRLGVSSASAPPADPSARPIRTRSINAHGYATNQTEFFNASESTVYDPARQLPATVSDGGVTRTYQWHPTFRLPTQIDETGGKRTVNTYDERGNLTEQTITATSGPATAQTWRWAYNTDNLLTSETDPRGSTTTHAYNSAGQRTSSTNALVHVTTYGYDAAGRLNHITQPDGLVQTMAYTPRGWLSESTHTAGGSALTTSYTYAPSGQVTQLRLPNGHVIDYRYDAAERLIGWTDNRGQRADYTLDPMGNITQELVRNSNGHLAQEIRRVINSLNRVQSETRGPSIVEHYTQDANGRLASIRDSANSTTTLSRDLRSRITTIMDPANRTARIFYNAQNAVTYATDFKSVTTTYTRDVLGNARSEATPDAGTAQSTYDALGLPTQVVDALGRATAITRDALGRPTSFTHSGTGLATLVTDLRYDLPGDACNAPGHASASRGRLCEMTDSSNGVPQVTTRYQWDAFGRLTRQTQTISSAIADHSQVRSVGYAYVASSAGSGAGVGELKSITYPSGSVLTHQHDATGRLTGLLWNGAPVLRNLTHNALGQPLSWTWALNATAGGTTEGTTLAALRSYNTAGELTATEFSQYTPDGRGLITALSQGLYRADGSGAWALENVPHTVQYDPTGRITAFTAEGSTSTFQRAQTFTFDGNGNRTSDTISTAGTPPVAYSHGMAGNSNRLTNFAGINITTNAAGDITSLAGRTMAHDSAGRLHQTTHTPACPSGNNCLGPQTTTSHHNGHGQRFLRTTPQGQSVFMYGTDQYTVLSETHQTSALTTSSTEHIYLPTASGPMPVIAIIDGQRFAVHSDHLNTPRRLTDASNQPRWQWAYSAFGDLPAQSLPAAGLSTVSYALRYPGQVDDGNGLFYNFNRFYDPRVGRYTQADPIGLDGGWNRFAYGNGNPMVYVDPMGLFGWADMPTVPKGAVNFGAGLGDALLLGTGGYLRELTGVYGGVDPCSGAYEAGAWTSFGFGAGRLAYAGISKGGAYFATSGVQASAFRQRLKSAFRFGAAKNWRPPDLSKYPTDAALRDAAGRTNPGMNAYGTGVGGAGAAGAMCGCPN